MPAPRRSGAAALLMAALALQGCAEGGVAGNLRAAGAVSTPDEFLVLPTKPLEMPDNLNALPPPAPLGTPNRVDYDPDAEAVASLTGKPGPAGNASAGPLLAQAGPEDPQIRSQLAVADAEYRKDHRGKLIPRLIIKNPDQLTYGGMTLDAPSAFDALRSQGVGVPPVPPAMLDK